MPKKTPLRLEELKAQSFVTIVEDPDGQKGGFHPVNTLICDTLSPNCVTSPIICDTLPEVCLRTEPVVCPIQTLAC